MKILITGAAGNIGRRLVEKLLTENSAEIYATDVKENPFPSHPKLNFRCLDLRSEEFTEWVKAVRPKQIVHLASILQISASLSREMAHDIDVKSTEALLQASVTMGVEKFIVTTSGAAYGYYPENRDVITESRATRGNASYFYSAHKAEVESIMARYQEQHPELKQIIFRPGAVLGPNFDGPVVNLFKQSLITGLVGYPGPFTFIWSEDLVDYIIEGLKGPITGPFNVAGDGVMTMKDIAKRLNKIYLPLPPLLIQAALAIAKPLGLTQYGPEQVKFIKYRPVLANDKIKSTFTHRARYSTAQALDAFLAQTQETDS